MPQTSALLIIDMINPFDFAGAASLRRAALPAARRIAALKARLKPRGVPAVYINDNFTQWQSDFRQLVAICSREGAPGAQIAALLAPEHDDYFVLKPRHSAFHATPLRILLERLGAQRLVVTGIAGDSCVLATAADAHMHEFEVIVPRDCVASQSAERNRRAIAVMKDALGADVRSARSVRA
ncbi:MAG TPA: isochorismatase family cysteine hydrolase [Luteimonas sp.]|nr:isochorismatase family cysteine hydrolase [Luteimonas sp.]